LGRGDESPPRVEREADPGALLLARDRVEQLRPESVGQLQRPRRRGMSGAVGDVAEETIGLEAAHRPSRSVPIPRRLWFITAPPPREANRHRERHDQDELPLRGPKRPRRGQVLSHRNASARVGGDGSWFEIRQVLFLNERPPPGIYT